MFKKIIFSLLIAASSLIYTCQMVTSEKTWRKNFNNNNKEIDTELKSLLDKLGHNPAITLLKDDNKNVTHQSSGPTLFVHGLMGGKDAYRPYSNCTNSKIIPGDVITFDFPDASQWIKQTIPYWLPLTKSSFAGQSDIDTLLYVLKVLHSKKCLPSVIYSHSRGAGVVLSVIGILNNPSQQDQATLNKYKITDTIRQEIINHIQCYYLITPLINFDTGLKQQMKKFWIPAFLMNSIKTKILPKLTHYKFGQKSPIDYITPLEANTIKGAIWLHLVEKDQDVSNKHDSEIINNLKNIVANENNLYCSKTGDGGHNDYANFLQRIIHACNKQHNCAYLIQDAELKKEDSSIIKDAQIKSSITIEDHLNNFSKKYTLSIPFYKKYILPFLRLSGIFALASYFYQSRI